MYEYENDEYVQGKVRARHSYVSMCTNMKMMNTFKVKYVSGTVRLERVRICK